MRATNGSAGRVSSTAGRSYCSTPPVAHHRDAVAEAERLVHVMRHEHDRGAEAALDVEQVLLRLGADDRIERTERLVHQQHRRFGGQRARHPDALLLAAGELVREFAARTRAGSSWNTLSSSSTRARMRAASQPSRRGTVAMFSATVRCGNRPWPWIA